MGAVPVDRSRKAFAEIDFAAPSPFALDFRAIHPISPVVSRTVMHEGDQRFRLSQKTQHFAHHVEVGPLVTAADVVDLAGLPALQCGPYRSGVFVCKDDCKAARGNSSGLTSCWLATRILARTSDSNVPASDHQPSMISQAIAFRSM